jgi:hypothetical protein
MDVPCPKSKSARPNIAGLTSPVQRAEMQLLLAGRWPPLKPLPVFKCETDEYRASIDFDKTRGEWVCRKTSLPSNKFQELRGGLTEMIMALPHIQAEVFAECAAPERQEQELEKDASRRLQALLEWRENYENGALYSGLQDYLSESQQAEIGDSIRLTLTARQLQFNPKNVAYVFDALSKAGGKLATLIETAQRNKSEQGAKVPAKAEAAASDAERRVPIEETASQASEIVTPEILDASPLSLLEDLQEKVHRHTPVAGFALQVRTGEVESSVDRIDDSPSHFYVLEISGFQVAAIMFLFAVISLTVGLTVGRNPLGKRLRDAGRSILAVDATSPALPDRPDETTSRTSIPQAANTFNTPAVNPAAPETQESLIDFDNSLGANKLDDATEKNSKETTRDSESFAKAPSTDSNSSPSMGSKPPANPEASPERKDLTVLIARNAPLRASPKPTHPAGAVGPTSGAPGNPAQRGATPAPRAAPHLPSLSTVLVTGPGDGSKPFTLILPEKPIAASSSFAMTSQLSVLVSPEPGPAPSHEPARLQAGELVSFVWPRYPKPGDRYGLSETVKIRTTIGELGQVLDVRQVSGSTSLLPAAMSAIRLWRYKPTLLNRRPVQAQQDVTIEFRPPHLPRVPTRHPSRN